MPHTNFKIILSNSQMNCISPSFLTRAILETAKGITISYGIKTIGKKVERRQRQYFYCKQDPERACMLNSCHLYIKWELLICHTPPKIQQNMF